MEGLWGIVTVGLIGAPSCRAVGARASNAPLCVTPGGPSTKHSPET